MTPEGDRYRPSGQVDFAPFLFLLLLGMLVALVMGFVLVLAENGFYFVIFSPLIIGLPVFGAILLLVRAGRCRNPVVGATVGLLLMLLYYGGYWTMSYLANVVARGPEAVRYVAEKGGGGLPGYVRFRARSTFLESEPAGTSHKDRKPNTADEVFNYAFYGVELAMLAWLGLICGRNNAGRVFYEHAKKW